MKQPQPMKQTLLLCLYFGGMVAGWAVIIALAYDLLLTVGAMNCGC